MNDRHSLQAKTVNMRYPAIIIYRNCSSTIANPLKRNADATAITPLTYANVVLFFKNDLDLLAAHEHFGVKDVRKPRRKVNNIGKGRVIDGAAYLSRIRKQLQKKK